jgi:DNA-binding NtrC family response regulator
MARHFLLEFNRKFGKSFTGIAPEAEAALKAYRWKGNVRELKNLVERGALIGKGTELALPDFGLGGDAARGDGAPEREQPSFASLPPEGVDMESVQESLVRHLIGQALKRTGGNESQAAKLLNLNHHTFRYRRRKLGL